MKKTPNLDLRLRQLETELSAVTAQRDAAVKALEDADRRAGTAERFLAYEKDSTQKRESWLREAKQAWGVHYNVSFDVVWEECLAMRQQIAALDNPSPELVSALLTSQATDDEGEFPILLDLLGFSGENKARTVAIAAIKALGEALAIAREAIKNTK